MFPRPLVRFFSFVPNAILSAPRVEAALNTERIIRAENVHRFASPIRVKMRTKGRGWTDFLNPITSHAPVLCSQRVVDQAVAESLRGVEFVPVTLEHEKKGTVLSPPCAYFWLIPTGTTLPYSVKTYHRSGNAYTHWFDADSLIEANLRAGENDFVYRSIPSYEKWDGSDVIKFREDDFAPCGRMFCSRKFVELAYREKWSNLRVAPHDAITGIGKELRDLPWPPELWYPANQPND